MTSWTSTDGEPLITNGITYWSYNHMCSFHSNVYHWIMIRYKNSTNVKNDRPLIINCHTAIASITWTNIWKLKYMHLKTTWWSARIAFCDQTNFKSKISFCNWLYISHIRTLLKPNNFLWNIANNKWNMHHQIGGYRKNNLPMVTMWKTFWSSD